jgi:DNA repair ATPase RecN
MKRKVTYLLKDFDAMMKKILSHTKDIKSQAQLLKNKEYIFKEIDKMSKKYDKIIKDISERDEESENEIQV